MEKTTESQAQPLEKAQDTVPARSRPDDQGHVRVDAFLKITDPNTGETFLETRA